MKTLHFALAALVAVVQPAGAATLPSEGMHPAAVPAAVALRQDMRKLWTDHVIWTRDYVVAAVADHPSAQAAAARLMRNQEDIGAAVAGFYGKAAGDKLTTLLKEHIAIAVDVVRVAKAGDAAGLAEAQARWGRNGDEIAAFLSGANPHLPRSVVADMMKQHLKTTTDEAVARLRKDWEADVQAFDAVYEHMLAMSDAIADGIIKQFPEKFAR